MSCNAAAAGGVCREAGPGHHELLRQPGSQSPSQHMLVVVSTGQKSVQLLSAGKRWVVVQNQNADPERIPMDLTLHDERPVFG